MFFKLKYPKNSILEEFTEEELSPELVLLLNRLSVILITYTNGSKYHSACSTEENVE